MPLTCNLQLEHYILNLIFQETIFKNFHQIRFRPEQFTEYLLSKEVGFVACEHLETPINRSQGRYLSLSPEDYFMLGTGT